MNIHPIFVHFPIALLTLYSLFELLRFRALLKQSWWFFVKAVFVIMGTASGFMALFTGALAQNLLRGDIIMRPLIHIHSIWAAGAIIIYAIIAFSYLARWVEQSGWYARRKADRFFITIAPPVGSLARIILKPRCVIPLALLGLIAVTVTGALGGAIVYGPNVDPIVSFVYHIFFK